MAEEIKVGSSVWVKDPNWPNWEPWSEKMIIGETSRSWLVGESWMTAAHERYALKVPKKGPHPGVVFTQQEIDDEDWVRVNRGPISTIVGRVKDVTVLREIAKLVGYKEQP